MNMMPTDIEAERGEPEDVASWLASCAADPVRFVKTAFPWGVEGTELAGASGPEEWQLWLLQQIKDGLLRPGEAIRVAISSGHGIGKSCAMAWTCLWAMSTSPDCRGVVTASSENMLYTRFRAELRKWYRLFRAREFFELTATSLLAVDPGHSDTWRVDMVPWNPNRSEAMAGLHNANRRVIVIFDEASSIDEIIYDTIEPIVTDANVEAIWVCCGNPLRADGRFRELFDGKHAHRWVTRHIDSRSISFTNKAELQRWVDDYGENSDFVLARVRGIFPQVGSDQFISPAAVDAAVKRELDPSHNDPLVIGVDVARYGSDQSVIFPRKGRDARSIAPLVFRGISLDKLEDYVVHFCANHPVAQIMIDGTGLGAGLCDHLIRRGFNVTDIQFAGRPQQMIDGVRYANRRAEIWGLLRHALRYLCLPDNAELKEQLCSPQYSFAKGGDAILLESKDLMRRRGAVSPDLGDALACTYGAEIAMLPQLAPWVQGQGPISEYDPFSRESILGMPLPESRQRQFVPAPGYANLRPEFGGPDPNHWDANWDPIESRWMNEPQ
jgi:hypothetical protein